MSNEQTAAIDAATERVTPLWSKFNLILLLLALGVLLVVHLKCQPTQLAHYTDPIIYLSGAESIATGHGYRFIAHAGEPRIGCHPPLHSTYLSLFWKLNPNFPENVWLLYGAMFACVLGTFVLFYRYCLKSKMPPVIAALLLLAWGLSAPWAALIYGFMSDILFGFLAMLLLTYWLEAKELHSARRWFITGLLVTAMYLTRTAASAVIAVLACVVAVQSWKRRDFKPALSFLAPIIPAVVLWRFWAADSPSYRDYIHFRMAELGGWKQTISYNLSSAVDYLSGLQLSHAVFGSTMDLPSNAAVVRSAWSPLLTTVSLVFCWSLTLFWIVGCWRSKSGIQRVLALAVGAYFLQLCLYPANLGERVLYVLLPFILVWAWKGTSLLPAKLINTSGWRWAVAAFLALNVLGNSVDFVKATHFLNTASHPEELAEVGAWLRTNSPPETVVAATLTEPITHFYHYSGRRVVENYLDGKETFSVAARSTNGSPVISYVLLDWYSNLKTNDLRCDLTLATESSNGRYRLYRIAPAREFKVATLP